LERKPWIVKLNLFDGSFPSVQQILSAFNSRFGERLGDEGKVKCDDKFMPLFEEGEQFELTRDENQAQYPIPTPLITRWYENRAREIDKKSGQVENAQELIRLGMKNGVPNLNPIRETLQLLGTLVYSVGKEMFLEEFEELPDIEKLYLCLDDSTEKTIVQNILVDKISFISYHFSFSSESCVSYFEKGSRKKRGGKKR